MKKRPVISKAKHWVDSDVLNLKHLLYETLHLKSTFPENESVAVLVDGLSSRYNTMLKHKRTEFYSRLIRDDPNKSKRMWQVINLELGRNRRDRTDFTDVITDANGLPFPTKKDLADALNDEFITAASRCGAPAANIPCAIAVLGGKITACDMSIRLKVFTPDEILKIINIHIASKTSRDMYGISSKTLKLAANPLAFMLSVLYNHCLRNGIYPTGLKKVKISPLYKGKGKKSDASSYRPISIVPAVSKILEVGINNRLLNFMAECNTLSHRQYAYRPGRATTDLVREVVWSVLSAREAGQHVALLSCDLSRAFDTANHDLIGQKLQFHGIRGPALSLLISFMSGRTQVVVGDGGRVRSSDLENLMGVPQGSCLSNTLFSLLLNDLPGLITDAEIFMYADDVAAVVSAPSEGELEIRLNKVVHELETWFRANGLALNREKTCLLGFCLNGARRAFKVTVGGATLKQVHNIKLLGFHLDGSLTWETHIDSLCSKLGSACFALRRLANTAPRDVVKSCYYATVHSTLSYGTELWARAAEWQRAFVMQKRAVRAIAGVPSDFSCRELFKELSIMTVTGELIYQVALFTHTHIDLFRRRGANAARAMRSNKHSHHLVTPTHKLKKSERSVYVMGPSVYNRLPEVIRDAASTAIFKTKLKKWLISSAFYDIKAFYELPLI